MALKADAWFRVHQHPNLEFELTLAGTLHEVRLTRCLPVEPDATNGPTLTDHAQGQLVFTEGSVARDEFLANRAGSVHQSFTKKDGCVILVLWSG